ncbi:metal ABC transporter permease [Acidobacteria bacterium AH-259-G07]|nr:metal ABC transporter permease [Acidobacteria bacterium AH-259-G07]
MEQIVQIMLPPFVACLILTGIHTYLGLHVVSRGVIFVDLALAQIAALGSTFAFLVGFDPASQTGYFYSLGFTFFGAAIFSISRLKDQRVPQEALIGIVFAVSSSAAILIADRAPQGAEHVAEMLSGAILWVSWSTIWKTLLIYSAIGVFHVVFRDKFLLISIEPEEAERRGLAVRWWDFLFYMSFGFVITSSVAIAGVLLVFSFLIIPSVIGVLYSKKIGTRLIIGWVSGTVVSSMGLLLSYQFDFPSGPSIVCSFGAFLILAAIVQYLVRTERKGRALARVGVGTLIVVLFLVLATQVRPPVSHLETPEETSLARVLQALEDLKREDRPSQNALALLNENQEVLKQGLKDGQIELDQRVVQRLGELGFSEAIPILTIVCDNTEDPWMRYYASSSLLHLGHKEGIHRLIQLLKEPGPAFLKAQVRDLLRQISGENFGYDPMSRQEESERSIDRWEVWWHEHAARWNKGVRP